MGSLHLSGVVVTGDENGMVKIWKRCSSSKGCLEFVKSYKSHLKPITAIAVDTVNDKAASVGKDGKIMVYDLKAYDCDNVVNTGEELGLAACYVGRSGNYIAVDKARDYSIGIYSVASSDADKHAGISSVNNAVASPAAVVKIHVSTVTGMVYDFAKGCVVSVDDKGFIEYWNAGIGDDGSVDDVGKFPNSLAFSSKFDRSTDLLKLAKKKIPIVSVCYSSKARLFAVYAGDEKIRVFDFDKGTIVVKLTDEIDKLTKGSSSSGGVVNLGNDIKIDGISLGKRVAVDREVRSSSVMKIDSYAAGKGTYQRLTMCFDFPGTHLLYPTLQGVKVVQIPTGVVSRVICSGDAALNRFVGVMVCDVDFKGSRQIDMDVDYRAKKYGGGSRGGGSNKRAKIDDGGGGNASSDGNSAGSVHDPVVITTSFNSKRIYCVSNLSVTNDKGDVVDQGRDVFNEPPDREDAINLGSNVRGKSDDIGREAVLRTTMGDIHVKLFGEECPRTVENFCKHGKDGYYDRTIMHRVIKGFMVQMGDPQGDGTGGESIWGGEFEDEFHRDLRHDRSFTLSMANCGKDTNGSQFFITTVPTPWLDGKHTVFGRVYKGMDVVSSIEQVNTDHLDRPTKDVLILSMDIIK